MRLAVPAVVLLVSLVGGTDAFAGPSSSGNASPGSVLELQVQRGDPALTAANVALLIVGVAVLVTLGFLLRRLRQDVVPMDTSGVVDAASHID